MSRLSIRLRVTAACAAAMAVLLAGLGLFLYDRLGSHLSLALDRELRTRSQDLAALVERPGGALAADRGRLVEPGESYAQLLDRSGRVLDGTPPLGTTPLLRPAELPDAPVFLDRGAVPGLDEPSRALAVPVPRGVLVVGATLQDRAETLSSFRDELLIAGPAALVLASLLGWLLAGLALRDVETMRRRAAAISADTPGERLPVPATGDELQRLGETLNEMLGRLEAALERERAFVADAGHELRTPLALLRTELELAVRHGESSEAVRRAAGEAARLSQLAEDLLLIARTDRGQLPLRREELAVDDLFATVASRFAWRTAVRADPAPGLRLDGDRLRLEQGLGNLVDNALRHGGGEVRLHATAENGTVELHVLDGGAGFPEAFLPNAFERFSRPDAARAGGGAGLGLAIVSAIAEAHGGAAHAANAETGADVWLELPA